MTDEAAKTRGILMEIVEAQQEQMEEDGRPLLHYVISRADMRRLLVELSPSRPSLFEPLPSEIGLNLPGQNETCAVVAFPRLAPTQRGKS